MADEDDLYDATIVSSDKDLLQLITDRVVMKMLKTKDYVGNCCLSSFGISILPAL